MAETFDLLMALNVLIAIAALLRDRPGTFVIAGNQVIVLRSLSNIAEFGQPRSMWYLPGSLFGSTEFETAALLFGVSTLIVAVAVALPGVAPPKTQPVLPTLPRWLLWLIGGYFVLYMFSTKTIFTMGYGLEGRQILDIELSGGRTLLLSLLVYELYRRVRVGQLGRLQVFGFLVVFFFLTDFIRGQTGNAAGYLVFAAFLILGIHRPRVKVRRWMVVFGAVLAAALFTVIIRGVRQSLHDQGAGAVATYAQSLAEEEQRRDQSGEGLEIATNGTQYAAHTLMGINLYDAGLSREWRSIYNPLINTLMPSFIAPRLGVERPEDPAVELRRYYTHGGGIYILGDLYWNGGLFCVIVISLFLCGVAYYVDTRLRNGFAPLFVACTFIPPLLMGVGYGFSHCTRGLINGCIFLGVYHVYQFILRARRSKAVALSPSTLPPLADR